MTEEPSPVAVFDRIASHFSRTRAYPWPAVETFLEDRAAEVGLDIGCGNGRHTAVLAGVTERTIGLDASRELLREAVNRAAGTGSGQREEAQFVGNLVQGDAVTLPIPGRTIDLALYIATIHHLRSREKRVRSLDELERILTEGGGALISAWSTEHERFDRDQGFDTTVDWTLPDGETLPRFYHVYDPDEFERDIRESSLTLREAWVEAGNCYAVVGPA
ncbi:MAG: class I SAM-dependent methyltransferase [Halodesulfurarchaeum sp.]